MKTGRERAMSELSAVNLEQVTEAIGKATKPVSILWQAPDSVAFVARGRVGRSEFHIDPSDEVMYMIKGTMDLHYITPEGSGRSLRCRRARYSTARPAPLARR